MFWVTENIKKRGMYVLGVIIVYETLVYVMLFIYTGVYTGLQCKVFYFKEKVAVYKGLKYLPDLSRHKR